MWRLNTQPSAEQKALRASIDSDNESLNIGGVLENWRSNPQFRQFWASSLCTIPFKAYCWEMPPLTDGVLSKPFECVFVDSPALNSSLPDVEPFAKYFTPEASENGFAMFESLGRDALLIAPYPHGPEQSYTHLAAFMRNASSAQIDQLWSGVAQAVDSRVGKLPIWLSTAGLGVSWLHVRVDSRPKYYRYGPYASVDYWNKVSPPLT